MKLHIHFNQGGVNVDEVVEGDTAEYIVAAMQKRVAAELGFLKGAVVRAMSPLAFAQEVTRQYNGATRENASIPASCEEFLQFGIDRGFASRVDDRADV